MGTLFISLFRRPALFRSLAAAPRLTSGIPGHSSPSRPLPDCALHSARPPSDNIGEVIIVAEKHSHATVAPLDDMMGICGCYHACYACHTRLFYPLYPLKPIFISGCPRPLQNPHSISCDGFFIDSQSRQSYTSFIQKIVPINKRTLAPFTIIR